MLCTFSTGVWQNRQWICTNKLHRNLCIKYWGILSDLKKLVQCYFTPKFNFLKFDLLLQICTKQQRGWKARISFKKNIFIVEFQNFYSTKLPSRAVFVVRFIFYSKILLCFGDCRLISFQRTLSWGLRASESLRSNSQFPFDVTMCITLSVA